MRGKLKGGYSLKKEANGEEVKAERDGSLRS